MLALAILNPANAQTEPATAAEPSRESAAAIAPDQAPIIIDSDSGETDLRTGITRVRDNVTIQRGNMYVEADTGEVIREEGRISVVKLTGQPVRWRDRLDDGTAVSGESLTIHFDVIQNIVTLTGNARLVHERGEFNGDELVYNLDTENLVGRSNEGNRVRVIIEPENRPIDDPTANSTDG
ncbi:MAG: lipopolysaccharide transport periplasmic protein LptA [Wenzhouxiangellaceae bacterium]|nr:lipopolysaccharide transport periplasmic protein LptA [Wenzhouxiangellaceae bacterium]